MKISFHGAAREVTGSSHLVEFNRKSVLLDCGMIQGGKERHERNREPFAFDVKKLDAVVLSHAHIDHSGRLPLLVKAGFKGKILATEPTCKLAEILLLDSAHIQEEDARYKIKRLRKQRKNHDWVAPLYTEDDAREALTRLEPVPFDKVHEIDGLGDVEFVRAGHILGAAIVQLNLRARGKSRSLVFSGDLGVESARLLGGPLPARCPEYLLIESTYGSRRRDDEDKTEMLYEVIHRTAERGGKVIIPSFAVGRTQAVLARINDLVESGRISGIPVFVDSPMATAATQVFKDFPDAFSDEARKLIHGGDRPLSFPGLNFTRSVDESKALNGFEGPCVIISASGMATAGRIKHHLKNNISDTRNTVLFVGYQANNSLGRVILRKTNPIRIFGDWYPLRASVARIEGFSAHADLDELCNWFGSLGGVPKRTYVVHGEEDTALSFAATLRGRFGADVEVPARGQTFQLK